MEINLISYITLYIFICIKSFRIRNFLKICLVKIGDRQKNPNIACMTFSNEAFQNNNFQLLNFWSEPRQVLVRT